MQENKGFKEEKVQQEEACVEKDKSTLTLFGRSFEKRKVIYAGLGGLIALAIVGGAVGWSLTSAPSEDGTEITEQTEMPMPEKKQEDEEEHVIQLGVKAEGWTEDSSPVIAHIVNEAEDIDYYHAYSANEKTQIDVPAKGGYSVSFISPVNSDGSIYKVKTAATVAAEVKKEETSIADRNELPFEFEKIPAKDVTAEDLNEIVEAVTEAVKGGDETLTGEDGVKVVEKVEENCNANPNVDKEAVKEETDKAAASAESGESTAKTPVKESTGNKGGSGSSSNTSSSGSSSSSSGGSSSGGSSSSGSGGSSSGSKPQHTHKWVEQTKTVHHDAEYKTVHHDAEYKTVHHDAVTEERHICNNCGADITGFESQHAKENILNGCGGHHSEWVVVQEAWDEQVLVKEAWDEQVLVKGAWDETVVTGYKCSGCGAVK